MNKVLAVMRREFLERVRTRSFLLGTVLVPLLMGLLGYLPQLLARRDTGSRRVVILNAGDPALGDSVVAALARDSIGRGGKQPRPRFLPVPVTVGPSEALDRVKDSVVATIGRREDGAGAPVGLLILTDEAVESGKVTYLGSNVGSFRDMGALDRTLGPVLRQERLRRHHADSALLAAAAVRLALVTGKVTEGRLTGESAEQAFWLAYIVNLLMYVVLLIYGMQVMQSVIEEKSNRIVEVLVSSMTPFQLLLGKVIGVGAVGLVQMGIWAGAGAYLSTQFAPSVGASASGLGGDGGPGAFSLPTVSPALVVVMLVFFLLGFFLYASLYAAVGAMCSTQQEAQQAQMPVTLSVAATMLAVFSLLNDPSGGLGMALTFIPLSAPIVVPVRYAIAPMPVAEVIAAGASLGVGILGVVWLAGRIYRVGILAYGKRPGPRDLWRWLRSG